MYKFDGANRLVQLSSNCSGTIYNYDANGNRTSTTLITISTTSKVTSELCGNDGQITLVPTDSTSKYQYQWSNGQTTASVNHLSAGNYSVIITEPVSGLTCNQSFVINKAFVDSVRVATDTPSCYKGNNGKAKVILVVPNPNGTYVFNWGNSTDTSFTATDSLVNLIPGNYTVNVKNTYTNCIKTIPFTIGQKAPFLTGIASTPMSCNASNDATATATVIGDTSLYVYAWKGPFSGTKNTQQINGLAQGTYILLCTQKNSACVMADTITIAAVPTFSSITKADSKCYKANNGTASVVVPQATNLYTYQWTGVFNGIQTTQQINNLAPGLYKVVVTETFGNHCSELDSVTITEPPQAILQDIITAPINCKGENDGIAEAQVVGSLEQYSYKWFYKNENRYISQTSYNVSNLAPGNYVLTVTSLSNDSCSVSKNFTIAESEISATSSIVYPNPTDGTVTMVICNLSTTSVSYFIGNSIGQLMQQGFKTAINGQVQFDLSQYSPGLYTITVIINGQKYNQKVIKR